MMEIIKDPANYHPLFGLLLSCVAVVYIAVDARRRK